MCVKNKSFHVICVGRVAVSNLTIICMQGNSKVLTKIHFQTVDALKFTAWLLKWPFGTAKDHYGLPKSLLPITAEICGSGVKIVFKGWPDPWLQACHAACVSI